MGSVTPLPRRPKAPDPDSELESLKAELAALKARAAAIPVPAPKESGAQIALRIRSGIGPVRPMVERCLTRPKDGKERWL